MVTKLFSRFCLTLCLFVSPIYAEVESVASHYFIGVPETEKSQPAAKTPVASMYVVRPLSITAQPKLLSKEPWAQNRKRALELRTLFRKAVEAQYREHGVLTGNLSPEVKADLDTILTGTSSLIAITEPGNPEKILQIVSFAYGELPMERRFRNEFDGFIREAPKAALSGGRFIEAYGSLQELALNSVLISHIPAIEGEFLEIKTLIRSKESNEDWVPTILRASIAFDLVRYGATPVPKNSKIDWKHFDPLILKSLNAQKEFLGGFSSLHPTKKIAPQISTVHSLFNLIHQAPKQRTVKISQIRIECEGPALFELYKSTYGFRDTGIRFINKDPKKTIYVLQSTREEFENNVINKLAHRKGMLFVENYENTVSDSPDLLFQPCPVILSQLGNKLAPLLNTRGAVLGNFRLF